MLDQQMIDAYPSAADLVQEIEKSTNKKLRSKVARVLINAFTHLNVIDAATQEGSRQFLRGLWLKHYEELLLDHERRRVWPKAVCTFTHNVLKTRWRRSQ